MSALDVILRDLISVDQWELNRDAARAELAQLRAESQRRLEDLEAIENKCAQLRQERDLLAIAVRGATRDIERITELLKERDALRATVETQATQLEQARLLLSDWIDGADQSVSAWLAANAPQPERAA